MKRQSTSGNINGAYRYFKNRTISAVTAFAIILSGICAIAFTTQPARAREGGSFTYTPGTYGDFAMNVFLPGLTIRDNIFYLYGTIDAYPIVLPPGMAVEADLELEAWVDLIQVVWTAENPTLFGGRYFAAISIPYAFNIDLKGTVGPFSEKESTDGLGDIQVVPLGIGWNKDYFHFSLAENIIAPTGQYDVDQLVNVGRNYWSFETLFGVTWLHQERGHEISFVASYTFNTENEDTDYKTGDEFHLEYTLAQHFSEKLAVGAVGYIYHQITDDSGDGYDGLNTMLGKDLDGYKSSSAGIGPAVMWTPEVGGRQLNLIAKWLYEYEGTEHFKGGLVFVAAAMTF